MIPFNVSLYAYHAGKKLNKHFYITERVFFLSDWKIVKENLEKSSFLSLGFILFDSQVKLWAMREPWST